jgi:hypothetical protein
MYALTGSVHPTAAGELLATLYRAGCARGSHQTWASGENPERLIRWPDRKYAATPRPVIPGYVRFARNVRSLPPGLGVFCLATAFRSDGGRGRRMEFVVIVRYKARQRGRTTGAESEG